MDTKSRQNREFIDWYRQQRSSTPIRQPVEQGQVVAPGNFYIDIDLVYLSGANGTSNGPNQYKYNAYTAGGKDDPDNLIEADVMFQESNRHIFKTNSYGELEYAATWGRGYLNDDDELVVVATNEKTAYQPCSSSGAANATGSQLDPNSLPIIEPPSTQSLTWSARHNGSTSQVDIGNPSELQITGAITVAAWVRTSDAVASTRSIVSKFNPTGNERGWYLLSASASPGKLRFIVSDNGTATEYAEGATDINDGEWHHVVGVFVPSTGIYVYVDGVIDGTSSTTHAAIHNSTANVGIGDRSSANYWEGDIRDVQIFNRELANFEIDKIYHGTSVTNSLVGRWKLNNTAVDSSDNSNDGTETDISYRSN